ncbi:MAG TPA: hypothetical protein VEG33_10270 [Streptosporangiaceae bacterium]|nr:hypothetical protein [Streptosporangiaceae bacterium]
MDEAAELHRRTEGWPAGLYIAALAIKAGSRHGDADITFTGGDILMGDYLRCRRPGPSARCRRAQR